MNFVLVFLGGGAGSVVRYLIGILFRKQLSLPLATFVSNVSACLIFALVLALTHEKTNAPPWRILLLTGFCGGLSTFSTFGFETYLLLKNGQTIVGLMNVLLSLVLCTFVFFIFRNQS